MPLVEYIRQGSKNQKIGTLIALADDDGEVLIGYSLCNTRLDEFNKHSGWDIALGRAFKFKGRDLDSIKIPYSIRKNMSRFIFRAHRYFKDKTLVNWANQILFISGCEAM